MYGRVVNCQPAIWSAECRAGRPRIPLSSGEICVASVTINPALALAVILAISAEGDISQLQRASAWVMGADDTVFQRQRTDAMTIKK